MNVSQRLFAKVFLPLGAALLLASFFYPVCTRGGVTNWLLLVFLTGIPFGISQMFMFVVPFGHGFQETVLILFFNVLIGGIIGMIFLAFRTGIAVITLIQILFEGVGYAIHRTGALR